MSFRFPYAARVALLLSCAGCLRRVEVIRPLRSDECPPKAPSRQRIAVRPDSEHPLRLSGRVQLAHPDGGLRPADDGRVAVRGLQERIPIGPDGWFSRDSLPEGERSIQLLRFGYQPLSATVRLDATVGAVVDADLEPQELDGCPGFQGVAERRWVWRWPWE